jgi:RNA polymerase sigma-70 factor (ECF subfamily)
MNKDTFRAKVLVHKDRMYRFALGYTKNTAEAEDLVQDVLMKLWETRHQLHEVRSLEAWCMSLTRNKALDLLKSAAHRRTTTGDALADTAAAPGPNPHQSLSEREALQWLMQHVATLPETQKAVFLLREVEGYSYLEICEALALDMNTVKVYIHRARLTVKEKMYQTERYGTQ